MQTKTFKFDEEEGANIVDHKPCIKMVDRDHFEHHLESKLYKIGVDDPAIQVNKSIKKRFHEHDKY